MELLNAYVDGELSASETRDVVRAVAHDPELAEQVVLLSQIKETVSEAFDSPVCNAPDMESILRQYDKPGRWPDFWNGCIKYLNPFNGHHKVRSGFAIVTGVAVLIALLWSGVTAPPGETGLVAKAIAHHRQWASAPLLKAGDVKKQLAQFQQGRHNIYVPDLSASKLRITEVDRFGEDGLHVGYVGTRRCHLSLFISPARNMGVRAITGRQIGESLAFTWRENKLEYVLLAMGMDQTRLRLIAEDVYQATRTMQPFDNETRMALVLNRNQSQPCAS